MTQQQWLELLSRYVKPGRYQHSLGVAQTARDMAIAFGADPEKAYWAGLMHDVAKGFSDGLAQVPAHGISFHHHSISAMS